jgi:hypothetical protein
MSGSRWRLPAVGATVVVSAATGILTNLITSDWSISLGVGLGALLVIGVVLQVALAAGDDPAGSADGEDHARLVPWLRQTANARGRATIVQAGGNVIIPPGGRPSPADGKGPSE